MTGTTTDPQLKVGVIGLGWAGQQHLAAYADLPGVEVVALAAQERDLLDSLGAQYGVTRLFESWTDLLQLPGLDAVSVAVPTFLHAPIAIAALERGVHVLSEKPIARDGDEGQRMVDAARRAGRVLEVAFNHRLRGDVQALAEVVSGGEIGRPYHARASWLRRRGIPLLGSWFTDRERAGGGPLIDIGVHVLDFSLHLLGEPRVVSVSAVTASELGPRGIGGMARETADRTRSASFDVEDFATAFLRLEGGGSLVIETSWAVYRDPQDVMDFRVFATDGGAELVIRAGSGEVSGDLTIHIDEAGEIADRRIEPVSGRAHDGVVSDFVSHVRDPRTWSAHDGSLALGRARIIDACYRSATEGREVTL
ncbi:Gfo/Idh/MocA family protein [Microbacterium sp.]|uniref:Gfo/Idh/MocA family protein n=1 Tax=Microbacterium sp. TaxID=51671 RepID=UPI0039E4B162